MAAGRVDDKLIRIIGSFRAGRDRETRQKLLLQLNDIVKPYGNTDSHHIEIHLEADNNPENVIENGRSESNRGFIYTDYELTGFFAPAAGSEEESRWKSAGHAVAPSN